MDVIDCFFIMITYLLFPVVSVCQCEARLNSGPFLPPQCFVDGADVVAHQEELPVCSSLSLSADEVDTDHPLSCNP